MMSNIDFRHALSAATFLLEEDRTAPNFRNEVARRLKCFETALVVSYARPFSAARGGVAPFSWGLMPKCWSLTSAEKVLHQNLIDARNKVYAHSDADISDISGEVWKTSFPNKREFEFLAVTGGETTLFSEGECQQIHTFLWRLRHSISEALQDHPAPRDHFPVRIIDCSSDDHP
ncbi:MAG: hypothetical protein JY451_13360 [Erythrobacter sp.]|nr:MAG: hypothetical protein JY451_13360 [Erythrobacter sp.]